MRICPKCLCQCTKFSPRGICTDCYDKDYSWKRNHPKVEVEDPTIEDLQEKWNK